MAGKIATRNAYGEALAELADKYPQLVVLDADLAGATMSKFFAAAHPEFAPIVCPLPYEGAESSHKRTFFPTPAGGDGFFTASFRRIK